MDIKRCIINRTSLFHDISACPPDQRDLFLENVDMLKHPDIRKKKKAKKLLFKNEVCKNLCQKLKERGIKIMIGGSSGLSVCYKPVTFTPNDIDMYVKNLTIDDVIQIEQCIKEVFPGTQIIVIRNVITLTWIVYRKKEIVYEFQLNILRINSWAEVLISTHSDIVSVCYDVLEDKFVYLKQRWESILDREKVHYFSDILTCDTGKSLFKATKKYNDRGFNCKTIFIGSNGVQPNENNIISGDGSDGSVVGLKLFKFLKKKYIGILNIHFGLHAIDLIKDLVDDDTRSIESFNIIDLWKLHSNENMPFYESPSKIELSEGIECPIEIEKHVVLVKNEKCPHSISMRAYLSSQLEITKCPLCRKKFVPKLKIFGKQ